MNMFQEGKNRCKTQKSIRNKYLQKIQKLVDMIH